jgi:hypothetical protein
MFGNRSTPQTVAMVFGVVYLVVAILGFLPFLGGSYTQTPNNLLGLVPINLLHNIVHLIIGIAGIAAAASLGGARTYLKTFGIVLLLLGLLGLFVQSPFGLVPIGGFDVAIHLVTGAVLTYFGFAREVGRARVAS